MVATFLCPVCHRQIREAEVSRDPATASVTVEFNHCEAPRSITFSERDYALASQPCPCRQGSSERVKVMRARVECGMSIFNPDDRSE